MGIVTPAEVPASVETNTLTGPSDRAQPPPPAYTAIGVIPAEVGWRIEWIDAGGNVTSIQPIVGWLLGTRTSDGLDLTVPVTYLYPVFFSQQTPGSYRFVSPSGLVLDPDTSK
jgi:hypothetical protein